MEHADRRKDVFMSAWRLLIAAILCGLLGAFALAQEEPGAPTPSDEDAER